MSQTTIDAEAVESTALVRRDPSNEQHGITPAQAKTDAIASLTMQAYGKASQLTLSPEEIAKLAEDFPDDAFKPGAAGKENLIYIEHAFLRDRLNSVFGPGQWALIPRNRWAEDFTLPARRDKPETHGSRIYVEAMLMIRGCFVSESVGAMEYYPSNNSQNYGDAVEGAKTAALRRCCKELGIGLQAWKKDWCNSWWDRQRPNRPPFQTRGFTGGNNNSGASEPVKRDANNTVPRSKDSAGEHRSAKLAEPARTVSHSGTAATVQQRDKMLEELLRIEDQDRILEYARAAAILLPTETLIDWPLRYVPVTQHQMTLATSAIRDFYDGEDAVKPFVNPDPVEVKAEKVTERELADVDNMPPAELSAWRNFPVPFGKNKDKTLGELAKNQLAWYCREFQVSEMFEGRDGKPVRKKPEAMEKDIEFRCALDAAAAELGIEKEAA